MISKPDRPRTPMFGLAVFLIATLITGVVFRWQITGISPAWTAGLDLRRTHSHLGFYGVLFPATWILFKSIGAWAPAKALLFFYGACVVLSGIGFLFWGYGGLSIAGSTGVLVVWLIFAWKTRPSAKPNLPPWLIVSSLSILATTGLIAVVAFLTRKDPAAANQVARCFLSVLLFGVFLPPALHRLGCPIRRPILWLIATLMASLHLTGLSRHLNLEPYHGVFGLGLIWISIEILRSIATSFSRESSRTPPVRRLLIYWVLLALGLGATGAGLLPHSHFFAIAGIHFMFLGPLLMTFGLVHLGLRPPLPLQWVYEGSLLTMVTAISLQGTASGHALHPHLISAISGSSLMLSLFGVLLYHLVSSKAPKRVGLSCLPARDSMTASQLSKPDQKNPEPSEQLQSPGTRVAIR